MSKNKDIDSLEQKIRELKSVVRHLQKRLKKASKGYRKHIIEEDDLDDRQLCEHCSKGYIKEMDILGRIFLSCNICNYKDKKNK